MSFSPKRPEGYEKPVLVCGPTMTKKSQQDETDINNIIKRYDRTGVLSHMAAHEPVYMDVDPITFQDAMQTVINAQQAFESLPSSIRSKFSNNPKEFLEYVQDPNNKDEAIELGLLPPAETGGPITEPVVSAENNQDNPLPAEPGS